MNFIDKIVETFDPKEALARQVARKKLDILNTGYGDHGASKTRKSLFGWRAKSKSAEDDIVLNLDTLRQRSRDLYMGAPIATGAIKTMRTNIVGPGLKHKAKIDDEILGWDEEKARIWERRTEKEFALWAESKECDAVRKNNFYEIQQLVQLSWLMSGDCFALLPSFERKNIPYDLRIRIIEGDRVSDPEPKIINKDVSGGVEVNENGEIVAYYIAQWHPGTEVTRPSITKNKNKWVRVPVYGETTGRLNILHLMDDERPEQRRGVPFLSPVMEHLKQITRYSEAELMAAVVSGMFTVFIKSDSPENPLAEMIDSDDQLDDKSDNDYELGNGGIIGLGEGESIDTANPGRPNTAFENFVTAVFREIGAGLEIPYELLVKHFTASYSASRAALLEAWKVFRMRRAWLVNDFCQPIYEEWLAEAISKGRIEAPGFFEDPLIKKAYCGAEWNGPCQGQLDPRKEVEAAKIRVEEGFSTRARETQELTGGDFDDNHKQRVKEETMRRNDNLVVENNNGSSYFEVNTEQ